MCTLHPKVQEIMDKRIDGIMDLAQDCFTEKPPLRTPVTRSQVYNAICDAVAESYREGRGLAIQECLWSLPKPYEEPTSNPFEGEVVPSGSIMNTWNWCVKAAQQNIEELKKSI